MKSLKSLALALTMLLACGISKADPIRHKFEMWGKTPKAEKIDLYFGWTNGFFQARGSRGEALATCLEIMTYDQAIAMIDKRYKDHPELWSHPLGDQILAALTVDGAPCQGKNSLQP
jgi:hypothetical protein